MGRLVREASSSDRRERNNQQQLVRRIPSGIPYAAWSAACESHLRVSQVAHLRVCLSHNRGVATHLPGLPAQKLRTRHLILLQCRLDLFLSHLHHFLSLAAAARADSRPAAAATAAATADDCASASQKRLDLANLHVLRDQLQELGLVFVLLLSGRGSSSGLFRACGLQQRRGASVKSQLVHGFSHDPGFAVHGDLLKLLEGHGSLGGVVPCCFRDENILELLQAQVVHVLCHRHHLRLCCSAAAFLVARRPVGLLALPTAIGRLTALAAQLRAVLGAARKSARAISHGVCREGGGDRGGTSDPEDFSIGR